MKWYRSWLQLQPSAIFVVYLQSKIFRNGGQSQICLIFFSIGLDFRWYILDFWFSFLSYSSILYYVVSHHIRNLQVGTWRNSPIFSKLPTFRQWRFSWYHYCVFFLFYQEDNVANQKEHLILLIANKHIRQTHPKTSNSKVFFLLFVNFDFTLSFTL